MDDVETSIAQTAITLSEEECWELLEIHTVGRLAVNNGRQPDIFPVNYLIADGSAGDRRILLRTAPGAKLASAVLGDRVAFEIDEIDHARRSGWSVVVHGRATEIVKLDELIAADERHLTPWDPSPKNHYIQIHPERITGRVIGGRSSLEGVIDAESEPQQSLAAYVDRVVVPLDGSEASRAGLVLGRNLAERLDLPLAVISIVEDMRRDAPDRMAALEPLLEELPPNVDQTIVQADAVGQAIAEEAAGALLCMATGADLFQQDRLVGSIAELVVASATGPVVVAGPRYMVDDPMSIARIVVAIDPEHRQSSLTVWATRLGYQLDVPVDFAHVETGEPLSVARRVERLERSEGQTIAERLVSEAEGAMLAVGSHGRRGLIRLSEGSVSGDVFTLATGPVLVLGPNVTHEV